ncbi:hypothetical protein EVJ30_06155 [Exiguobacterium sp. SH5S13]|nr:hypothetical protein EVJ30_06155 [Exiguobacterium sp. SH5S13]
MISARKTGLLFNHELIDVVASAIEQHRFQNIVVDPVMIANSGARERTDGYGSGTNGKTVHPYCHRPRITDRQRAWTDKSLGVQQAPEGGGFH